MIVEIDRSKCIASGACVVTCPEVFAQDDDGFVVLLQAEPPEELRAKVDEAANDCPTLAIDFTD